MPPKMHASPLNNLALEHGENGGEKASHSENQNGALLPRAMKTWDCYIRREHLLRTR